ncbi:hypothetical protein LJR257_006198 [Ensifer adhaerens]
MIRSMLAGAIVALMPFSSFAADLIVDYAPVARQCTELSQSSLTVEENVATLTKEVVSRMDEAIAVADDPRWIFSTRPAFVWASETKVACGKAYGYLRANWRDEDYLAKCDCFHAKMRRFMN